jgi:hypothetical protein
MKSHGLFMVGKFWIQSFPVLPTWTTDDIARVIRVDADNIVYVGKDTGWVPIGQLFNDVGAGTDPESAATYLNRSYTLKMENGNLVGYYEE